MRNKILAKHDSEREPVMSQPAVAALAPLPFELVYDDGQPLESDWHSIQLPLLQELLYQAMAEQGRADFFAGADIFVYYSHQQAREVWEEEEQGLEQRAFRGPDVFWVDGVDPDRKRKGWVAWHEDGRLPDVIFEMLSPSTADKDRGEKKEIYERVFRTAEYFLYDPGSGSLEGFHLVDRAYQPLRLGRRGRLPSERLGVSIGLWRGVIRKRRDTWVRLFRRDGTLVPTADERAEEESRRAEAERQRAQAEYQRAEAEHQRAEAAEQRAEAAEAELARLRALLGEPSRG
jgi:Uma2 family endonuclease